MFKYATPISVRITEPGTLLHSRALFQGFSFSRMAAAEHSAKKKSETKHPKKKKLEAEQSEEPAAKPPKKKKVEAKQTEEPLVKPPKKKKEDVEQTEEVAAKPTKGEKVKVFQPPPPEPQHSPTLLTPPPPQPFPTLPDRLKHVPTLPDQPASTIPHAPPPTSCTLPLPLSLLSFYFLHPFLVRCTLFHQTEADAQETTEKQEVEQKSIAELKEESRRYFFQNRLKYQQEVLHGVPSSKPIGPPLIFAQLGAELRPGKSATLPTPTQRCTTHTLPQLRTHRFRPECCDGLYPTDEGDGSNYGQIKTPSPVALHGTRSRTAFYSKLFVLLSDTSEL